MTNSILWPSIPQGRRAQILGMLFQLERSQWQSPEYTRKLQFEQIHQLLCHAYQTTSFYRERLDTLGWRPGTALTEEFWREVPILDRIDIQREGEALRSMAVPLTHGQSWEILTTGSTGRPVLVHGTDVTHFFWCCLTLRDHLWHKRDFSLSLAVIRDQATSSPVGETFENWGRATVDVFRTGSSAAFNINTPVDEQASWLLNVNPHYLLSYPTNIAALANHFAKSGNTLPNLREVRTFGEVLDPNVREACQRAFGVGVTDCYSANEVGYVALQCPQAFHYHIQSESVFVEILDDRGRVCAPGEFGRVVVTALHNMSTPLIRYDIGDIARAGEQCDCGRGLPVISRILGRQRNMLTLPDGRQIWPTFGDLESIKASLGGIQLASQFQFIQHGRRDIEMKAVVSQPWTPEEEQRIRNYYRTIMHPDICLRFSYVDAIPRGPSGKFEDFVSAL